MYNRDELIKAVCLHDNKISAYRDAGSFNRASPPPLSSSVSSYAKDDDKGHMRIFVGKDESGALRVTLDNSNHSGTEERVNRVCGKLLTALCRRQRRLSKNGEVWKRYGGHKGYTLESA